MGQSSILTLDICYLQNPPQKKQQQKKTGIMPLFVVIVPNQLVLHLEENILHASNYGTPRNFTEGARP